MLTDPEIVGGRPAAPRTGLRPAAIFALGLVLAIVACVGEPPSTDAASWRAVLARALSELRQADPESAGLLEELIRTAEVEQAAVVGKASGDRANRAWCAAMTCAADAVMELRQANDVAANRARERIDAAEYVVVHAEERGTAAGSSKKHARAAQSARLKLRMAESLLLSGDFEGSLDAADEAISLAETAQEAWRRQRDRIADPEHRAQWSKQVADTLALARQRRVPAIVVDKEAHRLFVYRDGRQVAVFRAELGTAGLAPKRHAGDCATPEGRYRVVTVKTGGATRYYKALLLDYPNADDRRRHRYEREAGTIEAGVGPGSLIEIHGHGGQGRDWTEGCIALRDEDMDRLVKMVAVGTPVTIVGGLD